MTFRPLITEVEISDGTTIPVPSDGVVAFVGPNNVGKSAALREIVLRLTIPESQMGVRPRVVRDVALEKHGGSADLDQWLSQHAFAQERAGELYYRRHQVDFQPRSHLRAHWEGGPPFHSLMPYLHYFAGADGRLGLAGSTGSYNVMTEPPTNPLQTLYTRVDLERRLADACEEAFGERVTVNRVSGSQIHLHVGLVEEEATVPPKPEYLEALGRLPMIQEQGDGMRSFIGLMLALSSTHYPLIFVDEPEAFLHPPQARLLGRKLATETPQGTQVFVATHSIDVLQGLLDATTGGVTVVRLTREGDINRTALLRAEEVRELWRDPLLRYSSVLDGLFHRGVILCESESDCRFYGAVLDVVRADTGQRPHDLLLTHCGGKNRLPTALAALRAVDVPVALVADLDVLRDQGLIRRLVEGLGGTWEEFRGDWNVLDAAVQSIARNPTVDYVREEVNKVLTRATTARLTRDLSAELRDHLRVEDGWAQLKKAGVGGLPSGDASNSAQRLRAHLQTLGIFVVPVGELERWIPSVGGHGPSWASEVLARRLHEDADLQARLFIGEIDSFLEPELDCPRTIKEPRVTEGEMPPESA